MPAVIPGNEIATDPACPDCCGECLQVTCICCQAGTCNTGPQLITIRPNAALVWDDSIRPEVHCSWSPEVSYVVGNDSRGNCNWFAGGNNFETPCGFAIFLYCLDGVWYLSLNAANPEQAGIDFELPGFDCCATTQTIGVTPMGPSLGYSGIPTAFTFTSCGCLATACTDLIATLPATIYCTISSPCAAADGKVITMTRSGVAPNYSWYGEEAIACDDCDLVYAQLDCSGVALCGQPNVSVGFLSSDSDSHPCGLTPPDPDLCFPFFAWLWDGIGPDVATGTTCYGAVGAGPCCDNGELDWTITI